jgi:hypothetical protein
MAFGYVGRVKRLIPYRLWCVSRTLKTRTRPNDSPSRPAQKDKETMNYCSDHFSKRLLRRAMLIKSLLRLIAVVVFVAIISTPVFAQPVELSPAPSSKISKLLPDLPPGIKPRPGHDELLSMKSVTGESHVVRLYCELDPYAIVMLPTGNLDIVARAKTKPTTNPFVAATADEIQKSLKAPELSNFKVEKGKSYIYFYDCSEGFFMHTRSILETMLPGVSDNLKSLGLKVREPEMPMVVVIMPNRAAFDAYHDVPKQVAAYYDIISNYIVMYEDEALVDKAPEFAAKQAGYIVAHEGVHQLLANCGIQRRLSNWSPWICEGIAEYYCPLKVNSSVVRKNNAELPERTMKWTKAGIFNDLQMYRLLKMNATGNSLKKLVGAENLDPDGYAMAWGLVYYLVNKKPEAFRAYMADVSKYEPLDESTAPVAGKVDRLFVKHFGSDFENIESDIQAYFTSKKTQANYIDPIENQTNYIVKCVEKQGKTFRIQAVITTSPGAAKKWKKETEAVTKNASFFTIVCKSRAEAERLAKIIK